MKKIGMITLLLTLSTTLALTGCQSGNSSSSMSTSSSQMSSSAPSSGEPSQPIEDLIPLSDEEEIALNTLLQSVTNFETGTAGSSLKRVTLAANLLDYAEMLGADKLPATQAITAQYLNKLAEEFRPQFDENLAGVIADATAITEGSTDVIGLLEDAGHPQKLEQYTPEKLTAMLTALTDAQTEITVK